MPLEDEQKPKQPVEFDQAINYVNKIKVGNMRWCTQQTETGTRSLFSAL
jgi:histone deacetylase complex regulatory component SIN3